MTDWSAIVREFGPVVWRTAFRLLGNHADAADCFQRAFLSAVEQPGTVGNWPGFLKRLATARALEQLRTRYRDAPRSRDLDDPPAPAADPLDAAAAGELADALRAALAEIDPQQAEVFCLVCLDGLSYPDAAAGLGVTANHAGVLLHRARAALRERLRAFDPNREHAPGGRS
jgi:RNA polymerase sigma-70 factor (ECF subfamily)